MTEYVKEVDDYPDRVCCSCEWKKAVTKVKLSDQLSNTVWPGLIDYQNLANDQLYMCNYCKNFEREREFTSYREHCFR